MHQSAQLYAALRQSFVDGHVGQWDVAVRRVLRCYPSDGTLWYLPDVAAVRLGGATAADAAMRQCGAAQRPDGVVPVNLDATLRRNARHVLAMPRVEPAPQCQTATVDSWRNTANEAGTAERSLESTGKTGGSPESTGNTPRAMALVRPGVDNHLVGATVAVKAGQSSAPAVCAAAALALAPDVVAARRLLGLGAGKTAANKGAPACDEHVLQRRLLGARAHAKPGALKRLRAPHVNSAPHPDQLQECASGAAPVRSKRLFYLAHDDAANAEQLCAARFWFGAQCRAARALHQPVHANWRKPSARSPLRFMSDGQHAGAATHVLMHRQDARDPAHLKTRVYASVDVADAVAPRARGRRHTWRRPAHVCDDARLANVVARPT